MKKKRSLFEVLLVTVVVVLTLILGAGLYSGRSKVQKSRMLIQELSMMRSGISLYKMVNNRYPSNLDALVDSTYEADMKTRPYVQKVFRNSDGEFVDPFGNSFIYNMNDGWVSSSTEAYVRW